MENKQKAAVASGGGLTLTGIVLGAKWLLQAAGDVDFVVTRAQDPGWVGGLLTAIFLDPPWYVVLVTFVVGLALLYWGLRRNAVDNQGLISDKKHNLGDTVKEELDTLRSALEAAKAEAERERADKKTIAKEATELRFAVQNREQALRGVYWELRYGNEYPALPDIPARQREPARLRAQEIRPSADDAHGYCLGWKP